jgi:hypothetical protein
MSGEQGLQAMTMEGTTDADEAARQPPVFASTHRIYR